MLFWLPLLLLARPSPAAASKWRLILSEDFSAPLPTSGEWIKDDYVEPFDTIVDDNGTWYHNDYGSAFRSALDSFDTYRRRFEFGKDGWLTASLSARDRSKGGAGPDFHIAPSITIETNDQGKKVLLLNTTDDHTAGAIITPTNALKSIYRIEYTLTSVNYGGKRDGTLEYDGHTNGYTNVGSCKTQHPWGEGSGAPGWDGDASAPYCEWQDVRPHNGFTFLSIVDVAHPSPRNRHFWNYHRKVQIDSNADFEGADGRMVCDAKTGELYPYQESSLNTINMRVNGLPNWFPPLGGLPETSHRFLSHCDESGSTKILSAAEMILPDESYQFAIERSAHGYTLEVSGIFARAGDQILRYFYPFEPEDRDPIWHYNTQREGYKGKFNDHLRQVGYEYGNAIWIDQWRAGSKFPDYFVIGDLSTNSYEGTASITDIKLYDGCYMEELLGPGVNLLTGDSKTTEDGSIALVQLDNGNLVILLHETITLWESGIDDSSTNTSEYYTLIQGDANMITRRGTPSNPGDILWTSRTVSTKGRYFFGIDCDAMHVQIVGGRPESDYGKPLYSRKLRYPTAQPTSSPTATPSAEPSMPDPFKVILNQGEELGSPFSNTYYGNCDLRLNNQTSSLSIFRHISPDSWALSWAGPSIASLERKIRIRDGDGSMEIYHVDNNGTEVVDYSTNNPLNVYPDAADTFQLVMNLDCTLQILKDGKHVVWSNNRSTGMNSRDPITNILQRSEMFHSDSYALVLQNDCNLVQLSGSVDLVDYNAVWSSRTSRSDLDDCYAYADVDKLRLYPGRFDRNTSGHSQEPYWEASDEDFGGYSIEFKEMGGVKAGPGCRSN